MPDTSSAPPPTQTSSSFLTLLKGFCIGIVDIIPGVSGGTMALILGIYSELVHTIRGLTFRPIANALKWLAKGRPDDERTAVRNQLASLNLRFLIPLLVGILVALVLGSWIIPKLMDRFPQLMRAFFFGLIGGSFMLPLKLASITTRSAFQAAVVFFLVGSFSGVVLTDPSMRLHPQDASWHRVISEEPTTLSELLSTMPTSFSKERLYWDPHNDALRTHVETTSPDLAYQLKVMHEGLLEVSPPPSTSPSASPYDAIAIAAGIGVEVPTLPFSLIFLFGMLAICAMILPGISGSYLLLILGAYTFILNSLTAAWTGVLNGIPHLQPFVFLAFFVGGALLGLLLFARLLSYLLDHYAPPTMGFLSGMMIGSLRGIWPFTHEIDGVLHPYIPSTVDFSVVSVTLVILFSVILIQGITRAGDYIRSKSNLDTE